MTEAAALAAAPLVGMGDKEAADQAAVDGMRYMLHSVPMDGVVVIGEGEKDEAPMLYNGEQIGDGSPPQVDIAVDPLEGTTLAAHGMPSALAVIALSSRGTMFDPGPCVYMEKMAGSPEIADLLDLDRPLGETVRLVAERKGCPIGDVMVVVLDRPRHEQGIAAIRAAGARVRLIAARRRVRGAARGHRALAGRPAVGHRRHARGRHLRGGGQVPRRSAAGTAVAARRGRAQGGRWRPATTSSGCSTRDDLVAGEDVFFSATGITDGDVLAGRALPERGRRDHRIAGDALALGHDQADQGHPRPREAASGRRRPLLGSRCRVLGSGASRPTRDSARSRRASERRKPRVMITWIRDWVAL